MIRNRTKKVTSEQIKHHMATLANDSAPDAEVVEATLVEGAFYSSIDSCEFHLLAVNSEGAVDYGRNGKFEVQFKPSPKTKYTMVAAGTQANYLLKDDGVIVRAVGNIGNMGIDCEISPPEKVKYTQVSSGYSASYFLRDDGKVDRQQYPVKPTNDGIPDKGKVRPNRCWARKIFTR